MQQSEEYKVLRKEFLDCEQRRTAYQVKAAELMDDGYIDVAEDQFRRATTESDKAVVIFWQMVRASSRLA
jgi:hypothetical protein